MSSDLRNNIKLSDRLMMSVGMADKGSTVADIGCDHAHTCIWLIKNGLFERAIAIDVRKGPLEKAKGNVSLYGLADRIELRLSDGLEALAVGEADTVMIAGMGGTLTKLILEKDLEKAVSAKKLILQPQSDIGLVRRFLRESGFRIIEERMCIESGKFYNSMKAVPASDNRKDNKDEKVCTVSLETKVFDEYGEFLLKTKNPVLKELLLNLQRKNERNLKSITASENERGRLKKLELEKEYEMLKKAFEFFDTNN
ncbi:MAG: class I SAM-dependent methyltransferase [Lachnospiraceae bacterium]|nr:class I SAM-dependent methyltransferase [Lachnospiraceae bacterium]